MKNYCNAKIRRLVSLLLGGVIRPGVAIPCMMLGITACAPIFGPLFYKEASPNPDMDRFEKALVCRMSLDDIVYFQQGYGLDETACGETVCSVDDKGHFIIFRFESRQLIAYQRARWRGPMDVEYGEWVDLCKETQ